MFLLDEHTSKMPDKYSETRLYIESNYEIVDVKMCTTLDPDRDQYLDVEVPYEIILKKG